MKDKSPLENANDKFPSRVRLWSDGTGISVGVFLPDQP